jgi:hypothetical protein
MWARLLGLIGRIPLLWMALIAGWLAVAPIVPEPHLVEKLRMLWQGQLTRAIDIFDLLFHAVPLLLLALRLWIAVRRPPQA